MSSSRTLKELRLFDNHILQDRETLSQNVSKDSRRDLTAGDTEENRKTSTPTKFYQVHRCITTCHCQDGGVAIGNAVAKCPTLRHLDLGRSLRRPKESAEMNGNEWK